MKRHFNRFAIFLSFTLIACVASLSVKGAAPAMTNDNAAAKTDGGNPELLVSTQWLADHLSDPHLVIVYVGHMPEDYHAAHIPGSRFLAMDKIVDDRPPGTELLPPEQLKKNLEDIGISDDSRVVYYAPDWDPMATRLFFTLDYIGHGEHAALLDGGMDRWLHEKRPTSTEDPAITRGMLTIHLHPEVVEKMDAMKKLVADDSSKSGVLIIDARPMKRYRAGHLPGAVPMFWETNLVNADDPVLKTPHELRQMFAKAGYTNGEKVVSYCEVGYQASYTYFVARYLGLNAAMYDGSYSEWSPAKQPVVRGDAAR
jgi:thiosulfate/3-mercaptopyruvate sulfurtransferase